jgi:hypothetical protein
LSCHPRFSTRPPLQACVSFHQGGARCRICNSLAPANILKLWFFDMQAVLTIVPENSELAPALPVPFTTCWARSLNAPSNYFQRLSSLTEGNGLELGAPPLVSMNLAIRSLRRAGFSFLFHEVHCRIHFELDKGPTPSSPEFWPCGWGWRWHRRLI